MLPSGTSSNEALHAEIKIWFLQTQQIHQSTLQLKLNILTFGKQWPHFAALRRPTLSQMSSQNVLARLVGISLWSSQAFEDWCRSNTEGSVICKADLPLQEKRESERFKTAQDVGQNMPFYSRGLNRSSCKYLHPCSVNTRLKHRVRRIPLQRVDASSHGRTHAKANSLR